MTIEEIIEYNNLNPKIDTSEIDIIINDVLTNNQMQVDQYKNGNEKAFNFFVGQIMKLGKQKGLQLNPQQINEKLKEKL